MFRSSWVNGAPSYLDTLVTFFGGLCIDDCDCSSRLEAEVIQEFIRLDRGQIKDLPARAALPYTHTHTHTHTHTPTHTHACIYTHTHTHSHGQLVPPKHTDLPLKIKLREKEWTCGHPLGETAVGFERKINHAFDVDSSRQKGKNVGSSEVMAVGFEGCVDITHTHTHKVSSRGRYVCLDEISLLYIHT